MTDETKNLLPIPEHLIPAHKFKTMSSKYARQLSKVAQNRLELMVFKLVKGIIVHSPVFARNIRVTEKSLANIDKIVIDVSTCDVQLLLKRGKTVSV